MTLLDTSAVLTLLWGESGDDEVAELLRGGDCAIPAACLGEVVDKLIRCDGNPPATVAEKLAPLLEEVVSVPVVDSTIGWRAGELRAQHYDRGEAALSQVDCLLLATAGPDDRIATSDEPLVRVALRIGIDVVPLPGSDGRRPSV